MPNPLQDLLDGFAEFRELHLHSDPRRFERLKRGQSPKVLVVGCSDSRVDPALLTQRGPGDLFVIRNVAALVPPCEADGRHHGTSAALEFGVCGLEVEHIVVLGHAHCGGVRALRQNACGCSHEASFIGDWVALAAGARATVLDAFADAPETVQARILEQATILVSLVNLMSYPWIAARVASGTLTLHGWYFDLETATLESYDAATARFVSAGTQDFDRLTLFFPDDNPVSAFTTAALADWRQEMGLPPTAQTPIVGVGRRPPAEVESCRVCLGIRGLIRRMNNGIAEVPDLSPCLERTTTQLRVPLRTPCPYEHTEDGPALPLDRYPALPPEPTDESRTAPPCCAAGGHR
jgi:carbonic anhydrase